MLPNHEPRCQGAMAVFLDNPLQAGSLPIDCIHCKRRTDIVPGYAHRYMQPPTWLPGSECPSRAAPDGEEVC